MARIGRSFPARPFVGAPQELGVVTGTSATTNAADTSSASGTTTVTGTVAYTNAADTSSAAGTHAAEIDANGSFHFSWIEEKLGVAATLVKHGEGLDS